VSVVKKVVTVAVGVLGIALIVWTAPAAGATLTAASCSYSDVNAKVGAAVDGDIVVVPAGNCAWTGGLAISKAITLKGSGTTVITNNNTTSHLITVTESLAGNIRIQGFDFRVGTGPTTTAPYFFIHIGWVTNGKPVLITANKFTLGGTNALGFKTNRGVVWNNTVNATVGGSACLNNASFVRHKPQALTSSWTTPSTFGNADTRGDLNLYIEANTLTDVLSAIDVDDNARTVFRYNTVINSLVSGHGADTSPYGARHVDIYKNNFVWDTSAKCGSAPTNLNHFIKLRGGTALIHDNTIPNITSQTWGNKPEVYFIIHNLRENNGSYKCWNQGYPAPHQIGWGYSIGGTRAGSTSVLQDPEPVYLWNNTGGGSSTPGIGDYSPDQCFTGQTTAMYVKEGRDYFVNTPKPGYTPFTYPHPLTAGGSQSVANPPTGVQVQ
jgi:hypothetical protein